VYTIADLLKQPQPMMRTVAGRLTSRSSSQLWKAQHPMRSTVQTGRRRDRIAGVDRLGVAMVLRFRAGNFVLAKQ
jgi:hypothetical protein